MRTQTNHRIESRHVFPIGLAIRGRKCSSHKGCFYVDCSVLAYHRGIIFPWRPPPHIPPTVLKNIRTHLLEQLCDVILEGYEDRSTQLLPSWPVPDEEEDEYEIGPSDKLLFN